MVVGRHPVVGLAGSERRFILAPHDPLLTVTAVAAGEPDDGSLGHGPVCAVVVLEGRVRGALAVLAL